MGSQLSYHEEIDKENVLKLRQLMDELPAYCKDFLGESSRELLPEPVLRMRMI